MRIVILDDFAENLSNVSEYLTSNGDHLVKSCDYSEAEEVVAGRDFDLLIASAICTDFDWIDFGLAMKRRSDNGMKVLIFTPQRLSDQDSDLLKELGFDGLINLEDLENLPEIIDGISSWESKDVCEAESIDCDRMEGVKQDILNSYILDLASKARKLEEILENSTDVIYELDRNGRIILISKVIETLTGYTRDELMGMSALELTSADSVELVADHISKMISGHEYPTAVEVGVQTTDGRVIPAEMIVRPIWQKKNVVGLLGIGRNVEERKRLEKSLKSAVNEKEFYLDLMAHDIQNFNQAIMGYLEMILSFEGLDPNLSRYAQGAFRQVTQIAQLIAHIKRVAQIRQMDREHSERMNLKTVLENSITKLQSRVDKSLVAISFNCPEGDYPIMAGEEIYDVLDLIISCAIRYSVSDLLHVKINVSSEFRHSQTYWVIELTGNNLRLSEPVIHCMISPDYSGCQMMERPDLQLLVVRAIIETFNGEIEAKCIENSRGDIFVIRIPKADDPKEGD
ncbi:MAG TPA: PAS domain S-box protein [Euryarchaeota archaeon]|nr:PAS domain S-box protein [Euryarchaeota archaeon]